VELHLSDLRNGESGIIISVGGSRGRDRGHGGRARRGWRFGKRLEDMGLTPGTTVTVVKAAPFNGPLEVYVRGSRLAIGRGMAERIFVEVKR
jgi:DtxR family Mn-dependent transcriptional regulator